MLFLYSVINPTAPSLPSFEVFFARSVLAVAHCTIGPDTPISKYYLIDITILTHVSKYFSTTTDVFHT